MALLKLDEKLYTRAPVEKEITFIGSDDNEHKGTVFVAQYGIAQTQRLIASLNEEGEVDASDNLAKGIAEVIVDDKGKPLYQPDDVKRFNQSLILALLTAIGEVNNPKPKNSEATKS